MDISHINQLYYIVFSFENIKHINWIKNGCICLLKIWISQGLCFTNFRDRVILEKIISKLREYPNMVFWNLAQDLMGIISGPLTGECKDHFECWPTLSSFLKQAIFLKIGSLLPCNKKCQQYLMGTFIVFDGADGVLSLKQ